MYSNWISVLIIVQSDGAASWLIRAIVNTEVGDRDFEHAMHEHSRIPARFHGMRARGPISCMPGMHDSWALYSMQCSRYASN